MDLKFGIHIKDHHIFVKFDGQGHSTKVKVTKVKNPKIPVFSLALEKVVQGHGGQGHKGQRSSSRSSRSMSQRSRSKLFGKFCTPSTSRRCDTRAFSWLSKTNLSIHRYSNPSGDTTLVFQANCIQW